MDTTGLAVRISGDGDGLRVGKPGEAFDEIVDGSHRGIPIGAVGRLAVAARTRQHQSAFEGLPVFHSGSVVAGSQSIIIRTTYPVT